MPRRKLTSLDRKTEFTISYIIEMIHLCEPSDDNILKLRLKLSEEEINDLWNLRSKIHEKYLKQ